MLANVRHVALFALLFSILGCASGTHPKPDWATAPDADIPALERFGWAVAEGSAPSTILDSQIRNAIRTELLRKGYVQSENAPDFLVGYETSPYQSTQSKSPFSVGFGVGSWGSHVGGSVGASVPVGGDGELRVEDRITIRALDRERKSELWIGTTTTFAATAEADEIERVVADLMQRFPARRP